ncbi:peptidase S10, serine carboxypeptidase [Clavulina sp. PMI_390]|nr:peptidase S10, serine carboxypeptidase [Clavulina sp. PMI_390]
MLAIRNLLVVFACFHATLSHRQPIDDWEQSVAAPPLDSSASNPLSSQPLRLEAIPSASPGEFTTLQHASFPHHKLRIKRLDDFCDPTVNAYAGYLDIISAGSKHLFFWFFESRSNPATDDVVMWINGGPGGSSGLGAFMELGPCSIDIEGTGSNRTRWNPHGWNANANIFFLDQPVGVGFSYSDHDVHVRDTPQAARDVEVFVNLFFEVFEEFKGRPFHLAGESFGGRYVPLFASEIYDGKKRAAKEGRTPINLQSILIGNGDSNPVEIMRSAYDITCTPASGHSPVLGIQPCIQMKSSVAYCHSLMRQSCLEILDHVACEAAIGACDAATMAPLIEANLNPYDVRKECIAERPLCYKEFAAIESWLNLDATREQLGIPESAPRYQGISFAVNGEFGASYDEHHRSDLHIAQLLERGVRTLIYVGVADAVCPWTGNNRTFSNLEWTGQAAFLASATRPWRAPTADDPAPDAIAGDIKSAHGLTFLTINEAGHMVPYDQPAAALTMLQAWLKQELAQSSLNTTQDIPETKFRSHSTLCLLLASVVPAIDAQRMMLATRALLVVCACFHTVFSHRQPADSSAQWVAAHPLDSSASNPLSSQPFHLEAIPSTPSGEFTTLQHALFPHHKLRIKRLEDFCDPTVNAFAGYLDIISAGSKHLFFWFFESRSNPATDDVIMWINGGPGGSSGLGAFMELGPCSIDVESTGTNRTRWNPHGWNANANIFFLDQPVGVGFSYSDNDLHVRDTPQAARDVEAFVSLFFEVFEEFKGRPFHMAGESFGGRYVPLFASEIYDGKKRAIKEGRTPINLQSILIGNGFSNPVDVIPSAYDISCTPASGGSPPLAIEACIQMRSSVAYCQSLMQKSCVETLDHIGCGAAADVCHVAVLGPLEQANVNPYDVRKECTGGWPLCYKEFAAIQNWMELNTTREQLGIPESAPQYIGVSFVVNSDFAAGYDDHHRSDLHVAQLLERGVRTLIYAGVTDSMCAWTGNNRTFSNLEWTGQTAFLNSPTRPWHASATAAADDDQAPNAVAAGEIKSANGLTFLTINEAGHMVPYDQPEVALAMLQAWLRKELV